MGCSKSDDTPDDDGGSEKATLEYVVVVQEAGVLKPKFLGGTIENISLKSNESSYVDKILPQLHNVKETSFLQYHKTNNCKGILTKHDFKLDTSIEVTVFEDLNNCELTVTAINQTKNAIFISYVVTTITPIAYKVRIIDWNDENFDFVDVTLTDKPVDLAIANNRLFVLTLDENITDENSVSVIDLNTNSIIHEMGLGYDAHRIFSNSADEIIVGYNELHTVINTTTFAVQYKQYGSLVAPNFAFSNSINFDEQGVLYYASNPGSKSEYPLIATSFDFDNMAVVLYSYENILSAEKRDNQYKIKTTSTVNIDVENRIVLIGYEKTEGSVKGGLLRIKLNDENEITAIDNMDLEGIPLEIIVL